MRRAIMAGLLAAAVATAAAGAGYRWRNVAVGGGGFAPGIVFSPVEPGLAYLRTDMGGAYRWDARPGRWVPLEDGLAEGSYQGVESVAADPLDPNVVYLAAGMGARAPAAILRSADRGAHWTVVPVPFAMGGNEDGRGLGERLAIDPDRTATLFFGSRHDGLQRSDDAGRHWRKIAGFPLPGLGLPTGPRATHGGIAFVAIDPASGRAGRGSRLLYAGSADPGAHHLFASRDGGVTWGPVAGGPDPALLPVKAAFDGKNHLVILYDDALGPNGITRGAVWRLDTATAAWRDITPAPDGPPGGYMGLAVDGQGGVLYVSTIDRWHPVDTVWRSADGGAHWQDLGLRSRRDVAATPFLLFDRATADFGHWIAGLAVDPFAPGHLAYTTGATVYATDHADQTGPLVWRPWVAGIEQTAIISLASPTAGVPLVSGFGDIAGFAHDDLSRSPAHLHRDPLLTNTNNLDHAGVAPRVMVRSGNGHGAPPWPVTLAWSGDGGHLWSPLVAARPDHPREDRDGAAAITVSADGRRFLVATPTPLLSVDHGDHWAAVAGLPPSARAVADKVDPRRFYAVDFAASHLLGSDDGGAGFHPLPGRGLPRDLAPARPRNREAPFPLLATPGKAGELWFLVDGRIYHSVDGGRRFAATGGALHAALFTLGRAAPGQRAPTLFAFGTLGGITALFRSVDGGARWLRINDDAHRWGLRIRVIEGDPKRFGRLYVGTDGRGILYGDDPSQRGAALDRARNR